MIDLLVLSPHADDAAFAAGGRIARAARAGQSVALLTMCRSDTWQRFADGEVRDAEDVAWVRALGIRHLTPLLDDAPRRDPRYRSGRRLTEWIDRDHPEVVKLIDHFDFVSAKTVLAPLGIGEHVDHQITHWAARAMKHCTVEFYEDMPYAAMPGHTAARLANLGHALGERPALGPGMRAWAKTPLVQQQPAIARPFIAWTLARSLRRRAKSPRVDWSFRDEPIDREDRLAAIACYATQWPLFFPTLAEWGEQIGASERYWTCSE